MSKAPTKQPAKKGRPPAESLALAAAYTDADLPLAQEHREAIEGVMPEEARLFYNHLAKNAYNATRAYVDFKGQSHMKRPDASTRQMGRYLRLRADVDLLVRDDFARMQMPVAEARARLASIAHHADLRLFMKECADPVTGEEGVVLDPAAILEYGDAVQEYTEEVSRDSRGRLVVKRKLKLYDRTAVFDKVIKHTPVNEGGQGGADVNVFQSVTAYIQQNTQITHEG